MTEWDLVERARQFKALGDPTRLRILLFLSECDREVSVDRRGAVRPVNGPTIGDVCCHVTGLDVVTSTISHHISQLRQAGLIHVTRRGRHMICSVNRRAVQDLLAVLSGEARHTELQSPCTHEGSEMNDTPSDAIREVVREKYGQAAKLVLQGGGQACCGTGNTACCSGDITIKDAITADLYSAHDASQMPEAALMASLGCGNPTALAELKQGEVVLDLGSGGGIDVLLSARRVGPSGFAYGLDMTDEMLELARRNQAEAGATNVEFLKGHIEAIPLPDNHVDVIISNCVINLSADKDAVLREAFRVLKPGGRFAVSDVVLDGALPEAIRKDMESYIGCVAGALERSEYVAKLRAAGFVDIQIEPTRRYTFADLAQSACTAAGVEALTPEERTRLDGRVFSAFIRARKPGV